MSEVPKFKEDEYIAENQPERLGLYERNMIQMEILIALGFKPHGEEKTDAEIRQERDWMAENRGLISEIMDGGEHAAEIRGLAEEKKFSEAAILIIGVLDLSRDI